VLLIPFRLGAVAYAVDVTDVRQVLPLPRLRPIPGAADWLRGVFVFQGAVMPVVDLCQLACGHACPERLSSRLLLVGNRGNTGQTPALGLLAEAVTQAVRADAVAVPRTVDGPIGPAYTGSWAEIDGQLVQMIAWESLATPEVRALYQKDPADDR
jgi:chemotaxis-related protein WspB